MPVLPTNIACRVAGDAANIDDNTQDDQSNTCDDFNDGKDEFNCNRDPQRRQGELIGERKTYLLRILELQRIE